VPQIWRSSDPDYKLSRGAVRSLRPFLLSTATVDLFCSPLPRWREESKGRFSTSLSQDPVVSGCGGTRFRGNNVFSPRHSGRLARCDSVEGFLLPLRTRNRRILAPVQQAPPLQFQHRTGSTTSRPGCCKLKSFRLTIRHRFNYVPARQLQVAVLSTRNSSSATDPSTP
jgi:hypothetical protein